MSDRKPMTLPRLAQMHASGEKIAMLTCYDAAFAGLLDEAGVDMLLIGDSLGNVLQGRGSTAPVNLDDMLYHTTCVRRGVKYAFVVADLPFDSYHVSKEEAWKNPSKRPSIEVVPRIFIRGKGRGNAVAESLATTDCSAAFSARVSVSRCSSRPMAC